MKFVSLLLLAAAAASCNSGSTEPSQTTAQSARIVALAPHIAELVFAAGAGSRLVAVSEYSDFPSEVAALPRIGDAFAVDLERLALIEPDLLLAWESGTPTATVDELRRHGYRVEVLRTRRLADIALALRAVGALAGTQDAANEAADKYLADIERLRRANSDLQPIRVFYQISKRPLYTVNGEHFISEIIALCGGRNVFSDVEGLAPTVSAEAVLDRDPEVLLAGRAAAEEMLFELWDRWPRMAANRYGNRFDVPAETLARATPRLAASATAVCDRLEKARENRALQGAAA